jgi:hypothetical protein
MALSAVLACAAFAGYSRLRARIHRDEMRVNGLRREVDVLRDSLLSMRAAAKWGGAVRPVVLREGTPDAGVTVLRPDPDAPLLPIVVVHDLMGEHEDPGSRWMLLRLVREPDGAEVWRRPQALREIWDPELRALLVLVPRAALRERATYRLEIEEGGAPTPRFSAAFAVP